ncbi:MAG: hypothetical protein QOK15_2912 [Nocardioidaceae bacterium]|nr:hypothetical protein [Nocardioidaceae bacterium]
MVSRHPLGNRQRGGRWGAYADRVAGDAGVHAHLDVVRSLTPALGSAVSLDEIARATLSGLLELPTVVRTAVALTRGGGRQLQFVSSDDDRMGASLRWCLIDAFDRIPLNDAARTGLDVYLETVDDLERRYPLIAERQRSLGTRSLVALALTAGDETLGALLVTFGAEQSFTSEERHLLSAVAAQVSQALKRERMLGARLSTAEALQRSLLPTDVPQPQGLAVCARYQPGGINAEVGGDWYDVFDTDHGSTAFVVGDVMGKGVQAAVLMGEIRTALRAYALTDPRPSVVLPLLDRFVSARGELDHLVTVVYGLVSPDRTRLLWSIAGHPPPILVRPDEAPVVLDEPRGAALGLGAGSWRESVVTLHPRDTVFAFTDGLVRGRQVDVFAGIERLLDHFEDLPRRRRTPRHLCTEARAAMDGIAGWDDVTMLAVGRATGAGRHAVQCLDSAPTAAGAARRFVRAELSSWQVDDDAVEVAQLCVSELVTNALLHGGPTSDLTVELDDDVVTVLVTDSGGKDVVERATADDTELISGRGLALDEVLTSAWGSERTAQGTTVWFELDVSDDEHAGSTVASA